MKERISLGFDYLWCSLYACAAFAIELLLVFVEGKLGIDNANMTVSQNISHWILTTVLWVTSGILVMYIAKKTPDSISGVIAKQCKNGNISQHL